ncbi:MAG: hypothetical protein GY941_26110 [Planctomycetes bacterium]|nr:hypothetical protein [Planctomycetota bacterium]
MDILVLCAGPDTITKDNVGQLKAKMVIPGSNISATAEGESLMFENRKPIHDEYSRAGFGGC